MNVFDFVKDINGDKKDLITNSSNPELTEKDYIPWIINKTFSYFSDTIWYANEMNKHADLSNRMQYDYFLRSINKGKRFAEQFKKTTSDDVQLIAKYFNYNIKRAEETLRILTVEQLQEIKDKIRIGGV